MPDTSSTAAFAMEAALRLRHGDETAAALTLLEQQLLGEEPSAGLALLRAQLLLDAGLPAVAEFETTLKLAPGNAEALLGLARALAADHRPDQAIAVIVQALAQAPFWVEGQVYLAKLGYMLGEAGYCASFDRALADPAAPILLWQNRVALAMQEGNHARALELVNLASTATGYSLVWEAHRAVCFDELGLSDEAARAFAKLGEPVDALTAVRLTRHLLRRGDWRSVEATAQPFLGGPHANMLWPYVALAWRLLNDGRIDWLEQQQGLVATYDLDLPSDDLTTLAQCLRRLHGLKRNPIDQSLRGGTQTDGYLFARIEPEISKLRSRLVEAIRQHIGSLPRRDPFHPILKHQRDRDIGFAGAWSVRLVDGGRHVSHIHPLGWFSSAFYVALPPPEPMEPNAGAFVLGEPDETLALDLNPYRIIRPIPGRLVLFPSTMWHGTRPFGNGERLTVAFDVALPA